MLGTAIGFANLLGFGSQCYRYGGGAFLIPFFVALFVLGIPMLILEGIVGKTFKLPLVSAYDHAIGRKGKVLGWLSIIAVTTIGAFYIVLTGWSLGYTYYALTASIPHDTATFFSQSFLKTTSSLNDFGTLSWPVFFFTGIVALLGWWVIAKDIQAGIEKWCSFFLPLLTVLVLVFLVAVSFLPGAFEGMAQFLTPDISKLKNIALWRDVFGQLFFSLSLGIGIVVGYSRHTRKTTNIRKAMMSVAIADFAISFLCGLITFGCLGYMAREQGIPFETIAKTSSIFEMGYVIFPLIIETLGKGFSQIIGALFFFSVFIAGITGVFSIVESVAGNIQVEFTCSRKKAVTIAMTIIALLSIPFCMGNGVFIIDALEPMVLGNNMLFGGVVQILVFLFLAHEIKDHPVWVRRDGKKNFFYKALIYFSLPILVISLTISIFNEMQSGFSLGFCLRVLWFFLALLIAYSLAFFGSKKEITLEGNYVQI